jgi:hypothetical protein
MSHHTSARLFAATALAVMLAACSGQSPVAPGVSASAEEGSLVAQASHGVPGVYALSFFAWVDGTYQEVSSLTVLTTPLILRADVTDSAGNPAQLGTVTFEYCSYLRRPPNDITRADEAPKEACEQGLAKWARLASVSVANGGNCLALGSGSACTDFGLVRIPRTVGFRFRYAQQKGSIAGGTSEARNFTWVAAS